ncbi:MAG: DUF3047 domain-containing protein [Pseudomonadota bacterium]
MLKTNKIILTLFLGLVSILSIDSFANSSNTDQITIGNFSSMDLAGWKNKFFAGKTSYKIEQENKNYFLLARSTRAASALYKKIKIDINETPFLNWSWRVDQALPVLDEKNKSNDDYAARIYVVFKTGFTPLSAKALNYVWSSNDQTGIYWPNPYTDKAIMIPIRCNLDETGIWRYEKVNVKTDLLKHFGKAPKYIDGIAIMTDTDNTKNIAKAAYGDIYFSSE